ncbi:MAG: metallophosphoesterase family protein [Gemmatimonadota bacterium]|nr:MAG: metallophosphoesterase family protein [Gemmatimonadota bacterium]
MTIGVVSDTHIPVRVSQLPEALVRAFRKVDIIMHAGDFVSFEAYEALRQLSRLEAVAGNMDDSELVSLLPSKKEIAVDGLTIGLIHGWGGPADLPGRMRAQFSSDIDCIVFGHSHVPYTRKEGQTLLFNPGSPVFSPNQTFGLLMVENGVISGEIIPC